MVQYAGQSLLSVCLAAASVSSCLLRLKKFSRSDNLSPHQRSHGPGTGIMTTDMTF
jgi:hypothetical protein